jgi:hypothetical protein
MVAANWVQTTNVTNGINPSLIFRLSFAAAKLIRTAPDWTILASGERIMIVSAEFRLGHVTVTV